MNYDKDGATLSVEIPAYTVELDHRELRTLLTYMARRNPDIVDVLGTSKYPIETLLQNYYGCMYLENMGRKKKGFLHGRASNAPGRIRYRGSAERL